LSLQEQSDKSFVPFSNKASFNPGDINEPNKIYHIDRIKVGFAEDIWRVKLEKGGILCGEIRFSKRDATSFRDWLNE
jgi:hypothetical protein